MDIRPQLTARLTLRAAGPEDSAFILELLNDPDWLANIGDRGVRSEVDALGYIHNNLCSHYRSFGYGLYVVQLNDTGKPIGLCGLIRRDYLPCPDLGFALLPAYVGRGYAAEAARRVMASAGSRGIDRLCAIVNPDNRRSIGLLERLGFRHDGACTLPQGDKVELYVTP